MRKRSIGEALGSISDRHIEEAAEYTAKKAIIPKWAVLTAACLCVIITALVFVFNMSKAPFPSGGNITNEYPDDLPSASASEYPKVTSSSQADWPYYNTSDEIVAASTNIYSGKVTDISFAVIDGRTGRVDGSPTSQSPFRMLYTVYTVSVDKNFKGDGSEAKICVSGGLLGYKEEEQYKLMESSGLLLKYGGIVICGSEQSTLAVGNEYIFCTSRNDEFDHIINPLQFAHHISSENARLIVDSCK